VAGERAQAARPSGRHNLRSRKLAAELVRGAGIVAGDLAVDVGAGTGAITRELDRAGARVLALELDHQLAGDLRRSFAGSARVRVVEGDALRHAWPDEPFAVVANVPFARTTELLRALLDPRVSLERAELVVGWELACKRTSVWPSTLLGVYWGAWHELSLVRRIAPAAFAPPPSVAAAVLRAARRGEPLVARAERAAYLALLRESFESRAPLRRVLPARAFLRFAEERGLDRGARAWDLDAAQWAALHAAVRASG
jgi:23S rRNA (adenine-N6)-dimethyltransferase